MNKKQRILPLTIIFILLFTIAQVIAAPTWPPTWVTTNSTPNMYSESLAVANDTVLYMVGTGTDVRKSTDGGVTYATLSGSGCSTPGNEKLTTSQDGQYVYLTCGNIGALRKSSDYGATWNSNILSGIYAMDTDTDETGQYLLAATPKGLIGPENFLWSTDYGVTWNTNTDAVAATGGGACVSKDGSVMTWVSDAATYQSTDYGSTWTSKGAFPTLATDGSGAAYYQVACSDDGQKIYVIGDYNGGLDTNGIAYSADGGASWSYFDTDSSVYYMIETNSDGSVAVTNKNNGTAVGMVTINNTGTPVVSDFYVLGGTHGLDFSFDDTRAWTVGFSGILYAEYEVPVSCVPDWSCDGYGTPVCYPDDTSNASCNSVTDLNACGENYTGNYSEFPDQVGVCDYCTPSWSCSSFGNCSSEDVLPCSAVNDTNACGESFNGTLSDYDGVCDYCTPSWTCTGYGACVEETQTQPCNSVGDTNLCYATTGLPSDQYGGNYSEFTPQACYTPGRYRGADFGVMVIDGIGIVLYTLLSLAAIVGLALVWNWMKKSMKKKGKQ